MLTAGRISYFKQQWGEKSLHGATIILVAHRLDTIIDNDMILVLGDGHVLEYGTPHDLLMRGSYFASMVNDTGKHLRFNTTLLMGLMWCTSIGIISI